jgi:hypothetical protein
MKSRSIGPLVLCCLLFPGFAGVWTLQKKIDTQFAGMHQEEDELVLRSGKLLKVLSLEYAPLVADLYWTRVVQYYGDKSVRHDANFELLWPLLDVATTLDPNLLVAYRFGSMFLSEAPPTGAGRPDLAIQLIQRGIQANPNYWRFYQDLGFIYYFELQDYDKAAAAFLEGSKNPESLGWMKVLAAKVTAEHSDNPETSRFLWNEIYTSATDPQMKENAAIHLQLLKAEADCKAIDELSSDYEKRNSKRPTSIQDFVSAGMLKGVPVDPQGVPYILDDQGKAQLDPEGSLAQKKKFFGKSLSDLAHPNK